MLGLAIKLLGIGRWLKEAITSLVSLIGKYPLQSALIASLCLAGWQWRGKQAALAELAAEKQAHAEQLAEIDKAIVANAAAQRAQKAAWEARSLGLAKENRHVEEKLRATLGTRAAAHAGRMRLDQVCRRDTSAAPGPDPAPLDHGPGPDAVILERRDYDTLIDNTVRLQAAHEWGVTLIRDGAAVPMVWPEPAF